MRDYDPGRSHFDTDKLTDAVWNIDIAEEGSIIMAPTLNEFIVTFRETE